MRTTYGNDMVEYKTYIFRLLNQLRCGDLHLYLQCGGVGTVRSYISCDRLPETIRRHGRTALQIYRIYNLSVLAQ